jgi:hydrogenase small subunit
MTSFVEQPGVEEVHLLWITAGLGCDGDTIALTAARQPSIEQLVEGCIPGLPRLTFHNPLLAYEVGDDFIALAQRAADGQMEPLILVIEGSIPDESLSADGCWAAFGVDQKSGQPIPTCRWIDRIAPHAWAVISAGTCAAYGGIHAIAGNPTGCMGLPDYLGWD